MRTQITKVMETETGHRLTNYNGKCAHLHGHRYRWEVTVTSHKLDGTGFVVDYGVLKDLMKEVIGPLDHALILNSNDPLLDYKDPFHMLRATNGDRPRLIVNDFNPTTENLIDWVAPQIDNELPIGLYLHKIRVWETSGSFAEREFASCL